MRLRSALLLGLGACASTSVSAPDVPIAFSRWRPPEGQACYVDEVQPADLPGVSSLLDSAEVAGALRSMPEGELLLAVSFDSLGRPGRVRLIDRRMPAELGDSVRRLIGQRLHAPAGPPWGARFRVVTGETTLLAIGRREVCPPTLARIEATAAPASALPERELELVPSPDWIIRGAGAPTGPPRSTLERAVAGQRARDSARAVLDSTTTEPDPLALGDDVLTLRVLIDTLGNIAHAEIARSAMQGVDRQRLLMELARYRFHPALEDRVRTPWWVLLRIR